MLRGHGSLAVFLVCCCGVHTACAPQRVQPPVLVNRHAATPPKTRWPEPSWSARFVSPTQLLACAHLEDSRRLCVGELGERWLDAANGAVPSPYLASESLVAAVPTAPGHFVFLGIHGTRFFSNSALGPVTARQLAPQRFHRFHLTEGYWYGLNDSGELWRGAFEDRVGTRLATSGEVYDYAVAPNGRGVVLTIPERLLLTEDAGDHFTTLNFGPLGVTAATSDAAGHVHLTAVLPSQAPAPAGIIVDDALQAQNLEVKLHAAPLPAPDTRALDEGRAVFSDHQWFELRHLDTGWHLTLGQFDGPLRLVKTEGLDDCAALRLAQHRQTLVVICQGRPESNHSEALTLRVAELPRPQFTRLTGTLNGHLREVRIRALDERRLLAVGLCATPDATRAKPGLASAAVESTATLVNVKQVSICSANRASIVSITPAPALGTQVSLAAVDALGANIVAPALAVSNDGHLAAFVARADGQSPWYLFLSNDQGHIFTPHAIDTLPVTSAPPPQAAAHRIKRVRAASIVHSLNFGEDNSLALVVKNADTPVVHNFDDRGQLIASSLPPPAVSRVDAVGPRILAVSLTERDVFQSMDRGASFERVGHLPSAACLTYSSCPVICRAAGCLIGERYTRVGWGAPGSDALDIAGNPELELTQSEPKTERVAFRTPLSCRISLHAQRLGTMAQAPSVEQTGLGNVLWYSVIENLDDASAGVFRFWRDLGHGTKSLAFSPLNAANSAGLAHQFDDAGVALLRSRQVPKVGGPVGEVELAAWLFKRETWVQARSHDATTLSNDDFYLLGADKARRLLPSVLSAAEGGVFTNLHAPKIDGGVQWVTPGSTSPLPAIPWPIKRVRDVHYSRFKNDWVVFALDESGSVLLRASRPITASAASGWTFAAQTVANPSFSLLSPSERTKFSWRDQPPLLFLAQATSGRHMQTITAHPLLDDAQLLGPSFDVTMPETWHETPPACTARDRRELSRIALPLLPHAARAVAIVEDDQPARWLLASQAVLYVNATRACLDVLWAETLPGQQVSRAVMPLDDLTHATVFVTERGQTRAVMAKCAFDASAKPAPEMETRVQARWNLEHLPLSDP